MNAKLLGPALLALTVALAGCDRGDHHGKDRHGRADVEAAAAEVKRTEADMLAAFKAKDPAKLARHYSDQAIVATPGRAAASGREAILKILGDDFRDPAFSLDFTNEKTEVARSGDLAFTRGSFRVGFTDPGTGKPQNMAGNYVTIFRKQEDGSWKAVADYVVPGAAESSPTLPLPPPKDGEGAAKAGG